MLLSTLVVSIRTAAERHLARLAQVAERPDRDEACSDALTAVTAGGRNGMD
ncbi:MAG TPA: hypothetical protein VER33_17835 [Polyangiaceae bacterium]|nr:hypothetical protein [Polyangiaceae bacterium]